LKSALIDKNLKKSIVTLLMMCRIKRSGILKNLNRRVNYTEYMREQHRVAIV